MCVYTAYIGSQTKDAGNDVNPKNAREAYRDQNKNDEDCNANNSWNHDNISLQKFRCVSFIVMRTIDATGLIIASIRYRINAWRFTSLRCNCRNNRCK